MADVVVTVPKPIWAAWILEGDAVGEPATGCEWAFYLGGGCPPIEPSERLYVVAWGHLRGYAPVTRVLRTTRGWAICREGGAVACTLPGKADLERSLKSGSMPLGTPARIDGFRGWRMRRWPREAEVPFPGWMTVGVVDRRQIASLEHELAAGTLP
jgi:hypothetical protein